MKTRLLITGIVIFSLVVLIPQAFAIGAPPPERVPASSHGVYDLKGNSIELVEVDEQITFSADLYNNQNTQQRVFYQAIVLNEREAEVYSGHFDTILEPNTSFSPAVSWIPKVPGYYKIIFSVSESPDNESRLSPDEFEEIYVVKSMLAVNENRSCNEDKELVFKINYKKVACVFPETLPKLLDRGWANWHDWYSPLFIDNLRQGPQAVDEIHAEFVKREVMKDPQVGKHFLRPVKMDYTCCSYLSDGNERNPQYQLVINFDLLNDKQLAVAYDLRQLKVVETKVSDMIKFGGPILESGPNTELTEEVIEKYGLITFKQYLEIQDWLETCHQDGYTDEECDTLVKQLIIYPGDSGEPVIIKPNVKFRGQAAFEVCDYLGLICPEIVSFIGIEKDNQIQFSYQHSWDDEHYEFIIENNTIKSVHFSGDDFER